ncbi:class I SAM-dependent methyltransferase [Cellulophaga sp. L1A9]|uniref:class I SAM-dependent methyltransferase n=1 Tax=Cellulophaga sp. L1A9 TaxID=2686362 RepID=UPI00131D2B0B|nr:class I SAM-dependent methyltransferase [Cellulophaga sp. L1A9]
MKKSKNQSPKKRWATKDVMHQIYENHLWGGAEFDFYSGDGSHVDAITEPYIKEVSAFLKSFESPLVVCDVGCGDFNIGNQLIGFSEKYFAVDIVPALIERNKARFKNDNLEFLCLDICEADLPKADCIFVRQVLQHLSNAEIQSFLSQLKNYPYCIVTEHIPNGDYEPNIDMVTGMGNRVKKKSGVAIMAHPFNFKPIASYELLRIVLDDESSIQTMVYQNF